MRNWAAIVAIAATCTACGGAQPADPEAAAGTAAGTASETSAAGAATPEYREVTVPAGTALPLQLRSAVASDTSNVEDAVRAELREAITIDGREVVPAGATLVGIVTEAERSGRVRGLARVAYRFNSMQIGDSQYDITTGTIAHEAEATKSEDATKIAIGAGAGAAIGAVLGGGDGAAKGAAIGGAAGTGTVLATRGEEVRLGPGANVTARLTEPLTLRVRVN